MTFKSTIVGLLTAAMLLGIPRVLPAETVYLFGRIGGFPVIAAVEKFESKLDGWYFYPSRAQKIHLTGTMEKDGTFRLDEETQAGAKTGIFAGKAAQGKWTGTWRKSEKAVALTFDLAENRDPLKGLSGEFACAFKEKDARFGFTYERSLKLDVAAGAVRKLDIAQGAYTAAKGDEQWCTFGLGGKNEPDSLKQVPSEAGILFAAGKPDEEGDYAGCTIRIVADRDFIWIAIGGGSGGEGGDCRSIGETMLCSPRAFWNDIIYDRRTGKCKAPR